MIMRACEEGARVRGREEGRVGGLVAQKKRIFCA